MVFTRGALARRLGGRNFLACTLMLLMLATAFLPTHSHAATDVPDVPDVPDMQVNPDALPLICEEPPPAEAKGAVLIPELKGIALMDSKEKLFREAHTFNGVDARRVEFLGDSREFKQAICGWLNRPLTFDELNALSNRVVRFYREHSRPVVDVLAPEQDISQGTVQLLVLEGRVGSMRAEGNKYFDSDLLLSYLRLDEGDEFDSERLLVDLTALNNNPFRQVDLVYERGEGERTTNVVLRTDDQWPYRVFTGYQNNGDRTEASDRFNLGFNLGNVFGMDQQASYQLSADPSYYHDPEHGRVMTNDVTYVIPLPWNDRIIFQGEYSMSHPSFVQPFNFDGVTLNLLLRYAQPLQRWGEWDQELQWGFDYKKTNNNFAFGGFTLSKQSSEILQFRLDYSLTHRAKWGDTDMTWSWVASPGDLTGDNNVAAFNESGVAGAKANYMYARFDAHQSVNLPWEMEYHTHFLGEIANSNLLSSEQINLGGPVLRGYTEGAAAGSQGFLFQNELHFPPISFNKLGDFGLTDDKFYALAFVDYGRVGSRMTPAGAPAYTQLASAGLGVRYSIGPYLSFTFDYGFPLTASNALNRAQVGHFALTIAY